MKKSVRVYLTGTVNGMFFKQFVKENIEKLKLRGFMRDRDDGRMELFLEGEGDRVKEMVEILKKEPKHTQIRNVEVKEEKFQDFKEFKVLHI
jgi:acylphosphatase